MRFGAHMSVGGGIWTALTRAKEVDCEIVQLFVKNNMQWFGKPYAAESLDRYRQERDADSFDVIFGHTGYLINVAGPDSANREKSLQSLTQEVELATSLELPFLVLHPGAHLRQGEEEGLAQAVRGLDAVLDSTRDSPVRIALENTAGQGSCLGHRLDHLATIYQKVKQPERLAICLDTAHFFEAGYNVHEKKGWEKTIRELDRLIGIDQVVAFHLNDSQTDFGSRVDRHAGIGQGKMGREAFRHIVRDSRFKNSPGCLETPKSKDLHEDRENLAILRALRDGK